MTRSALGRWGVASAALLGLGLALRCHNALAYKVNRGFDALGNWRYIRYLLHTWELPAPDADWSTAHPPLFYYLAAGIGRLFDLGEPDRASLVIPVRLGVSVLGVCAIALAMLLVHRLDPGRPRRTLIAGALLLFLPVHIYMSAMLSEEILVTSLASLAMVAVALDLHRPRQAEAARGTRLAPAVVAGVAGGLALLTKLSALMTVLAVAGGYALAGWRRPGRASATPRVAIVLMLALALGGWWYVQNRVRYGYVYPDHLPTHAIMITQPPGERHVSDYLRIPLATWTDPRMVNPDLLRSIWGGTHATVWFDGHRHFLPKEAPGLRGMALAILLLALLPTAAFGTGLWRGAGRAIRTPGGADTPLVMVSLLTLAGYVLFTWRNPYFAAVKGSFLLPGLSVPFAVYASEALADWTGGRGGRPALVWTALGALWLSCAATFTIGPVFEKSHSEIAGLEWSPLPPR